MLQAVCAINYHEALELVQLPEEGGEGAAEVTDEQRERINEQNEEIEK